ncbi:TonB-dependent siderophore receptor [Acetobacter oryzifermentans]|uniref:TonB-dependent siderophore receptor n=1 Tax=Acetobacter oryzifermentans TaxID=1633874 RepID=UPI0009ED0598|nr:TonB-dependent receptor [Acetobacter oryzifermentans]
MLPLRHSHRCYSRLYQGLTGPNFGTPTTNSYSAFTWRAGVTYNSVIGLSPYFSYATSFIPQIGAFNANGEPEKPLAGHQLEAGLKYLIPTTDVLLTAAAYHIKENHYQISDTEYSGYEVDAGTVISKGVELSANANITKDIHLTASYSFNDMRVGKSDTMEDRTDIYGNVLGEVSESGKYVGGVPRNMVNMFVDYTPSGKTFLGLGMNFGVRYIGSTFADNANSFKAPAYTLFDIGAHYDFGKIFHKLNGLKIQMSMSNLANTRYITSCTGGGGACYYGQARRVYGNISYSW